jgi:hypothetical protein
METPEFLRFVLPSTGTFCAFTLVDKFPRHKFFTNIDNLSQHLLQMSAKGHNAYYAVSSFAKEHRTQEHTALTKAVFLDVDCGADKPYPTWKDGLKALGEFISAAQLPQPTIVASGNGLHVYWVLDEELPPDRWRPLATSLKECCKMHSFHVDPTVVTDSARVLRAPGTMNMKGNRWVKVLLASPQVTVASLTTALGKYVPTQVTVHTPKKTTTLLDNLAVKQEYPPANATVVATKCQQIGWAVKNQADVPEPFWYALMGIAAFCATPEDVAKEWSKDHPDYNEAATLKKLAHWQQAATGPTTCNKFESERPDGCKKCRFHGRIGSPARLGLQFQEVEVARDAPDKEAFEVPIPKPYKRTVDGIKLATDGTDIDVCKFDIYPVGYGSDDTLGFETVRYHWKRPHVGWTELAFRQAYLAEHSGREFATAIADKGIVLAGKKQTESFQTMLRAYMDNLRQIRTVTNLYSTMGWKDDNTSFLLGDKLFRADSTGTVKTEHTSLASQSQRVGEHLYTTAGTVDEWAQFTSLLQKANMPVHMFVLGLGFAAPLFQFTGLKGLTVNLCGPTGGGKTLAQLWQQSIYGDPTKLHFSAKFTQNAVFSRFGMYCNLPVTIDETTMMPDKEVGDFTYWVSQGRDKARLTKTSEEKDAKTWATICTTSANRSMASKLYATGMDTDAQMARLLEINVNPHPLFTKSTDAGRLVYGHITSHYGAVGEVYIKYLVSMGEAAIRAMIAEHIVEFKKTYKVNFSGQERFWEQAIILADLGLKIAKSLGLIQFDYTIGIMHVLTSMGAIRTAAASVKMDCFDVLAQYMNEHAGYSLTIMHTAGQKPTYDYTRLPRNGLRLRFDVYRPSSGSNFTHGTLMLDRLHFKTWLAANRADINQVWEDFRKAGIDVTPKSGKFSIGKDTPIKAGQIYVIGLSLAHDRLQGVLNDADDTVDNLTLGRLQVVS